MFFEPPPVPEETAPAAPAPWKTPPADVVGTVVPIGQVIAQSASAAVVLPLIRAYPSGCVLEVEIVSRLGEEADNDWPYNNRPEIAGRTLPGGGLHDRQLRMGIRFADGSKVTTVKDRPRWESKEAPTGPVLSLWPTGSGPRGWGTEFEIFRCLLWLWPLPPPEPIEFAVEWPSGGIELTFAELDGTAVRAAGERALRLWPDGP